MQKTQTFFSFNFSVSSSSHHHRVWTRREGRRERRRRFVEETWTGDGPSFRFKKMVKKVRLVEEIFSLLPPFYYGERICRSSLLLIALDEFASSGARFHHRRRRRIKRTPPPKKSLSGLFLKVLATETISVVFIRIAGYHHRLSSKNLYKTGHRGE